MLKLKAAYVQAGKRQLMLASEAAIALLRAQHSDALICVQCELLLATRPESYRMSNLTETERLAYVCAECREERTGVVSLAEIRA
jgi:hypothetical protein